MKRCSLVLPVVVAVLSVLPAVARAYLWCDDADQIYASVYGNSVTVYHDAAVYNCCPDYFEYEVDLEPQLISVAETEILTTPCDCMCCFNLSATIEDVPPGEYDVRFRWFDYEASDFRERLLHVAVSGDAGEGTPAVSQVANSGCVEVTSVGAPPTTGGSWGWIKALYR